MAEVVAAVAFVAAADTELVHAGAGVIVVPVEVGDTEAPGPEHRVDA